MHVLVLYHSRSGNTKKLAEEIAKGVEEAGLPAPSGAPVRAAAGGRQAGEVKAILKSAAEVTGEDFKLCDGLIAGSPVYFGTMAAELKAVFERFVVTRRNMEGKIGAAFATSADASGGKETTLMSIIQAMLIYGMVIAGDPLEATGHYGISCAGAPDEKTLANARKLGKRVAMLVTRMAL
jgi:NAD(P)H dehydrogenase (quinone)